MTLALRITTGLLSLVLIAGCELPGAEEQPLSAQESLRDRIELTGAWFLANADADEFIRYEYLVDSEKYTNDNNELRKMGAAWSITELHRFTGDERYRELAQQGIVHFRQYIVHDPEGFAYIDVDGKRKLGQSGLLSMALLGLEPSPGRDQLLRELADGILSQQQENGSYDTYFYSDQNTGQDYYPGEASLALVSLYEETSDERYKDSVARSFPYYRDYWRGNRTWAFIPWHSQVLTKLERLDPREEYRTFIYEMNDWLLEGQQTPEKHEEEMEIGGFGSDPGISTASYLEGLNDAYALAKEAGDSQHAERYAEAIRLGAAFLLRLQYTEDQRFGLRSVPAHVLGGVRQSLRSDRLRVDNNQHAVAALIKAYENDLLPLDR